MHKGHLKKDISEKIIEVLKEAFILSQRGNEDSKTFDKKMAINCHFDFDHLMTGMSLKVSKNLEPFREVHLLQGREERKHYL